MVRVFLAAVFFLFCGSAFAVGLLQSGMMGSSSQSVMTFTQSSGNSPAMPGALPSTTGIPSLQSGNTQDLSNLCTPDAIAQNPLLARKCSEFQGKNKPVQGNQVFPPLQETEFQRFVKDTTGEILPLYGYSMFDSAPDTFAPVDGVPVTADYALGPGDEVVVKIWGQLDADLHLKVDRDGAIYIPKVGSVNVAGVRFQDLRGYLKDAIGKYFRNFDLAVNMGQLRSIQVYVVGQARRPGNYTVSSLSTLVTALFASGGPSSTGSMRHIQLKRGGEVVTELDLYDFLLEGDKSKDMPLLPGDVIYIPPAGHVAAIAGSVKNPAIYELKDDSDLANLIAMAGGLTTTASGQKVQVDRIDSHRDRMVEDFDLDKEGLSKTIRDGDLVRVFSISPRFGNAVTLRGNVAFPFRTAWKKGMRITDLIPDRDVLVTKDYWLRRDRMRIETKVTGIKDVNSYGQNSTEQNSTKQNLTEQNLTEQNSTGQNSTDNKSKEKSASMWLQGEVGHSLAGIDWDYAVIERFDWKTLRTNLIPFNLGRAILDHDPSQNLELEPGDVVTVFSVDEMKIPVQKQIRLVTVEGEVNYSGVYEARPGETLRQLVQRIGGMTPDAYLFGAVFTRESTRKLQQQRLEESISRMEQDVAKSTATVAQGAMDQKALDAAKLQEQTQQAMLEKMKKVRATGRIVLEIPPGANSVKDIPDIALEDGDRLYIPAKPSTVGVFGEVYNENNAFFYNADKHVSDYLDQAGGPMRDADEDRIFVLRADGSVISAQTDRGIFSSSFSNMRLMPGDALVVPQKLDMTPFVKSFVDWTQIVLNMGVGLASLKVLGLI